MDEQHDDHPETLRHPPEPGGFRPDEVTDDEMRRIRDSYLGVGTHDGAITEWEEMKRAFGDLVRDSREQQGLYRDESEKDRNAFREAAAKDRLTLFQVAQRQAEEGRRNLDQFIAEGQQRREDLTLALKTMGDGVDRLVAGVDRMQDGFYRLQRTVFGVGVVVVLALGIAVASWIKADRVERRYQNGGDVLRTAAAAQVQP